MAASKKKSRDWQFPQTIHVAWDPNARFQTELLAFKETGEAIDGDGPTVIAEYRLVRSRRYGKKTVDVDTGEAA